MGVKSSHGVLTVVGVAVVMLIIGLAIGSVVFPVEKTSTLTVTTTLPNILTRSNASFDYATMPRLFMVEDYAFAMIYNGTGYSYTAGYQHLMNLDFALVLNVTWLQTGSSQIAMFGWGAPSPPPFTLPTPQVANLFGGRIQMTWSYPSNTVGNSGVLLNIMVANNNSGTT